jgi:arylsulfatase
MLGNRAMYLDGWMASTVPPRVPWDRSTRPIDVQNLEWQLYNLNLDFSQSRDVAARHPEKLAELRRAFDEDAKRYNVYPVAADVMARLNPATRPSLTYGRKQFSYYAGETRYTGGSFVPLERGGRLAATLAVTSPAATGTAFVQGDVVGGLGLFLAEGRPRFVYNPVGRPPERLILEAAAPLAPGVHEIGVVVTPEDSGPRAARIDLLVDGKVAASARAPIYYVPRGEGYVGRPGVRHLLPGGEDARPQGFTLERLDVLRP